MSTKAIHRKQAGEIAQGGLDPVLRTLNATLRKLSLSKGTELWSLLGAEKYHSVLQKIDLMVEWEEAWRKKANFTHSYAKHWQLKLENKWSKKNWYVHLSDNFKKRQHCKCGNEEAHLLTLSTIFFIILLLTNAWIFELSVSIPFNILMSFKISIVFILSG